MEGATPIFGDPKALLEMHLYELIWTRDLLEVEKDQVEEEIDELRERIRAMVKIVTFGPRRRRTGILADHAGEEG